MFKTNYFDYASVSNNFMNSHLNSKPGVSNSNLWKGHILKKRREKTYPRASKGGINAGDLKNKQTLKNFDDDMGLTRVSDRPHVACGLLVRDLCWKVNFFIFLSCFFGSRVFNQFDVRSRFFLTGDNRLSDANDETSWVKYSNETRETSFNWAEQKNVSCHSNEILAYLLPCVSGIVTSLTRYGGFTL